MSSTCTSVGLVHTSYALFLSLGLLSTLIRHENEASRKRSSNQRNLKTPACRFSVDRKHLEDLVSDGVIKLAYILRGISGL